MSKEQQTFWRWEKVVVENELTIQGSSYFDRQRDVVIVKPRDPDSLTGEIIKDQLNVEWDKELVLDKRFADCFVDLQDRDVTLRDVELEINDTKDTDTWLHVSIVGRVQGIDYQHSQFTLDEYKSSIRSIEHLALNHAQIERSGMHIFRLYEFENWILVSDALKQKLQALKINGMRFLPIAPNLS